MREALAIRLELGESRVQVILNFFIKYIPIFNLFFRFGFKIDEQNGENAKIPEKLLDDHLRVPIFYHVAVSWRAFLTDT